MYVYLFVCLLLLKSVSMFSLVPHVALSLFSVLECDVYVQLKKKEMKLKNIYQQHK